MNILLIEDDSKYRLLIPKAITKACSNENQSPDITVISKEKELEDEIQKALKGYYDLVLVDTELGKHNANSFVLRLIEENTDTPLLSISSTPELSKRYSIPYIGKDIYIKNKSILNDIYNGKWKKKRQENKEKRTQALKKILKEK